MGVDGWRLPVEGVEEGLLHVQRVRVLAVGEGRLVLARSTTPAFGCGREYKVLDAQVDNFQFWSGPRGDVLLARLATPARSAVEDSNSCWHG